MRLPGSEQMGYRGSKERMRRYLRKLRKEASLMEPEQIQQTDLFPRSTHRIHVAGDPASARKYHEVTDTFIMSQAPGSEELEEKEDPSLSHDLALLFVMKEHMWDGPSHPVEKDTSQELEKGPRDLENWEDSSNGKQNLREGQLSLKESRESSLNSCDGEFARCSSTSSQSFLLDTTSPALSYPRTVSAGQTESQVCDASVGQPPSLCDTHSPTWHEESATTDALPCQEDSVNESSLVIHRVSNCPQSADFANWKLETQQEERRSSYDGMDIAMRVNELSSKREEASNRLSNPSSEEEELNLDGTQRKAENVLFQVPFKDVKEHSDVDDETGGSEENVLNFLVLQLQEEEESNAGVSSSPLLKRNVKTDDKVRNMNCGEPKSHQKQLSSSTRKPEFAESKPLELACSEEEGGKDLNEKAAKSNTTTNLEEVERSHKDQEEQEWTVRATIDSAPIRLGQDTLDSLENNLALSGFNDNSSEELAFSLKEVSSADHSPTSGCVQTTTIPFPGMTPAGFQPGSGSPRMQAALYHISGEMEHSGIYDEANTVICCDQDGAQPTDGVGEEDVEKEDIGKEENARSVDGKQITQLFIDVELGNDSQDLSSSDAEENPVPSLRTIITALLQEDPIKGATEETVPCAGDESVLHFSSQPERATGDDEASAPDSDGDDRLSASGEDFLEDPQSSPSKVLPNPSLEEGLSNIAKEMIQLSLSSWGSAEDATENDVKSHRQLKPTIKNAALSGKEAATDTHCIEHDSLTSESPYFVVLGKERTECHCNVDSLLSCRTPVAMATDAAQMTQPLTPVPEGDSEQMLVLKSASFVSSRKPLQFVIPPPTANFNAQPTPPGLNPDRLLEQLSSSSQVNPLTPKSSGNETVLEHSSLAPETRLSEQLSTSESDLDQCGRVPHSVHSFKQSVPVSHHASLPVLPRRSVFPSLSFSAASQRTNSKQIAQSVAAGPGQTQPPCITVSRGSHSSRSDSNSRKYLLVGDNLSTQQRVDASENNPLVSRTGSDEPTHPSPQVGRRASWNSSSISKRGDLVLVSSLDDRTEDFSGLPLATGPELGLSLSDLQSELLGNGATGTDSFTSIPETTSRFEDTPDGRLARYTLHPSGEREKSYETKSANVRQAPSLLAFTNPIHFLQLGPPSPPSFPYPGVHPDLQWPEHEAKMPDDPTASFSEGPGRFRKLLEKPSGEPVWLAIHRKGLEGRHPRLEKSSSCPDKDTIGLGTKESAFGTKKQEAGAKQRAKSRDWHRQRLRKISIPTDGAVEAAIASLHLQEEAAAHKDRANHLDFVKYGEKKTPESLENIKRRRSKLIHSSKLLYQEYSDDALNKAIQSQKQADSLSEEVEPISPKLRKKVLISQDSYLHRLSVSSGSSLWQDIPMVRGSTMLLSMTREEQKLQEAKFELIASEASYLRSLNVAVDHFQHSQDLQGVLTTQDKQWLFSRLQDVRDVSANFLFELEEKLEENMFTFNVCDVALRNAPEFRRVYLPYVTNQTYQDQTFQRLMNGVPAFQQVLEKLESDPVCQRLSLKSFLILPFQRITRLKLLLQNILKRIPPGADEEVQATQAYDALEKLIKDCNANVQRMKSTEELIHLSQNMEFECKIFPLISQSRRLVKHGELTALEYNISLKWKLTTRPIYLHLFNDYLLLSRPRENGRFIVFDYAASSDVRGEKCEMKLHGDNKNLFRLFLLQNNQGKKVEFLFRTETQSEKLRWISALMPQQPEPDLLDDSDAAQVHCVKSYKAREHDELTLEKADIVMVLRQSSDGWIKGVKLSDGERGWFPFDHVEVISSRQVRQMNLKEEQRVKNAKQQVFRRR